jgi:ferredoxin
VSGRIEVHVDATRCVGSGNCEFWAPGLLEVSDEGVAVVVGDPAEHAEAAAAAAQHCPTQAISVTADDGPPAG